MDRRALLGGLAGTALALPFLARRARAETVYPLKIRHAFGETVIPAAPQRVATVSWANQEVPLALGIVPVGFPRVTWGDDDGDGLLPWVKARLTELNAPTPVLFDEGDGIDFEAVASVEPDVILAAYSGLSWRDYATLSQIAPVVAFPEAAWSTDWRQTIRMNSTGLGKAAEGDALVAKLEGMIATTRAAHPEFAAQKALLMAHTDATNLSTIHFYAMQDPRVQYLAEFGLAPARAVAETQGNGKFYGSFSAENIDAFSDVTLIVTYGGPDLLEAMQKNPLTAKMPAIQTGAFVHLAGNPLGASGNPTALSLPATISDYAALLSSKLHV